MSQALLKPECLLSLLPQPLHLIIEGQTRSGKTWLAQQLAKELAVHTEVWSSLGFPFSRTVEYPIIPDAPIYKSDFSSDGLPSVWQERVEFWKKNINSKKCIIIDEIPNLINFNQNNFLTQYLCSRSSQTTNLILTTQISIGIKGCFLETQDSLNSNNIKSLMLNYYNRLVFNNFQHKFLVIRLGWNARKYAEFTLKNRSLVYQIRSAKFPCLIGDKVIDLSKFAQK